MAVAFDKFTNLGSGTGTISATVTPVGTPRGVLVFVLSAPIAADEVSGVTYGGVSMNEVSVSPALFDSTEDVAAHAFFLGSSIPTGAQTCEISVSGSTAKVAYCITLTADADTEVVDAEKAEFQTTAIGDQTLTLALGGRTSFAAVGVAAGNNSPTEISPLTSWNNNTTTYEHDFGSQSAACYYYTIVGTSDVTAGYSTSASPRDVAMIAVAVSEFVSSSAPTLVTASAINITATGATPQLTATW